MATLDTDFSEGDIFTAGATTSTSSLNGIMATVNSNTITKLIYVGSDLTSTTIASSTNETTLLTVTIPADTIATGALVIVGCEGQAQAANVNTSTFRIKSGVASSEAERLALASTKLAGQYRGDPLVYYDTAPTWSGDVNIIVTGQNSHSSADSKTTAVSMVVYGV